MKAAVITFPGSNCNRDMLVALKNVFPHVEEIWHGDTSLPQGLDFIAIPGGFSYGDYLRCGAIAAHSPIMREVIKFANNGGIVLGVCNGFQILIEAGLLDGVLLRNKNLKFICKTADLKITNRNSIFTNRYETDSVKLPISHHDGNYFCDNDALKSLQDNQQIAFTYANNPNGSIADIAGIFNKNKNVLGMMPHPERAVDSATGNIDGQKLFTSLLK
jgi:phosphoribosylformylglycinamidine synthase